jgi:hypothetical protein
LDSMIAQNHDIINVRYRNIMQAKYSACQLLLYLAILLLRYHDIQTSRYLAI